MNMCICIYIYIYIYIYFFFYIYVYIYKGVSYYMIIDESSYLESISCCFLVVFTKIKVPLIWFCFKK